MDALEVKYTVERIGMQIALIKIVGDTRVVLFLESDPSVFTERLRFSRAMDRACANMVGNS